MTTDTRKYCIISHTHWDREWYIPLENFRMRLVDLMDNLIEILDNDPEYRFHLDAQTIVLDDYLEIRPNRREKLMGYVKSGKLLVGPWYVQNDFHLTSGEATVRNLLIGTKIANDFGKCMQVGYAADQFGLCSQLPQILYRYGLDNCIFGRGFARGESQFYWASEDGSKILCEHMFAWYNNAQRFANNGEAALALARNRGQMCADRGKTHNYLMMNGVDHLEAQEDLTEVIAKVQPLLEEDEAFFQDTMPEYIERVKAEIAEKNLELTTYTGEFRDLGAANVLTGTLASRVYLKQQNAYCQALLEKKFEPLYAANTAFGLKDFPQEYGTYMWKVLIQNHPHDSICGCSVDAVHDHMMDRFIRVRENADDLVGRGTELWLNHVDRTGLNDRQYFVLCVNSTQRTYSGVMDAVVEIPADEDIGSFVLTDPKGAIVPFEVVSVKPGMEKRILSPINLPGGKTVNVYTIRFRQSKLPGMTHRALLLTPAEGALPATVERKKAPNRMENEFLKVSINKNGTIDLTNKKTGITYAGALLMEDNVDLGTAYNYFENDGTPIITSENVRAKIVKTVDSTLRQERKISYSMKIDREHGTGKVDIEITLTLDKGNDTLGVAIKLNNACMRHRLRVLMPTGIATDINYAGQPYDVITRTKVSKFNDDKTHPNTDFVGIDAPDGKSGFAVFQEGLYEYEHMDGKDDGTLAITLLRAVHRITGGFEGEQTMAQEWVTPGGECLGEQSYRLALYPYAGNHEDAAVALAAQQFMMPPYTAVQGIDRNKFIGGRPFVQGPGMPDIFYRPMPREEIVIRREESLLTVTDETVKGAMILAATKGAENMDGTLIVRLYNSTSKEIDFKVKFGHKVEWVKTTTLAEQDIAPLKVVGGNAVSYTAKPKEIVTLRVKMK